MQAQHSRLLTSLEVTAHRVPNGFAKSVERVGLRKYGNAQCPGRESAFGGFLHKKHQLVHRAIIALCQAEASEGPRAG